VTITNCFVSGYDIGSLLDATYKRNVKEAPDHDGPTGRLKFGTESNGGFKNIVISNIVFDHCRGLALETVDGGLLEDVAINNITMRDIVNAPIFLRLGRRMRGPKGVPAGELRRINISNVVVYNADPRYPSIIAGIPDKLIEDVKLSNIRILYKGGGTKERAALDPPERETNYPEPSMFGDLPAYGFFIRHASRIELSSVEVNVKAQASVQGPIFVLNNVVGFSTHQCPRVPDLRLAHVDRKTL